MALLGAIAVIALTGQSVEDAARAVDLPTIVLLFAFMVVSAQMRLGGFYTAVTRRVAALPLSRRGLLAALIAVAGALSAVFSNDIVCLAMTPVVARLCLQRGLNPVPFLIGLACAANIGSAATLIGNPQNMLIGSVLQLPFADYVRQALPPVAAEPGCCCGCGWPAGRARACRAPAAPLPAHRPVQADDDAALRRLADRQGPGGGRGAAADLPVHRLAARRRRAGRRGCAAAQPAAAFGARDGLCRLAAAAAVHRPVRRQPRLREHRAGGRRPWPGWAATACTWRAGPLLVVGVLLSNLVSNVPAVMLLLPHLQGDAAGVTLALVSTFAGNLLLVGSIANLIVVDLARKSGIAIDWKQHALIGIPVTLGTLALVWAWLG